MTERTPKKTPSVERQQMTAAVEGGASYVNVAASFGVPIGTVKSSVNRVRRWRAAQKRPAVEGQGDVAAN
jgi:DNA-directed RNA polymerase specialized sigma24 family protein